jgi:DNA-binding response OmpR family regulator
VSETRILVVEDDRYWREDILKEILIGEGYMVETASTYDEAIDQLQMADFSLAVVDIGLSEKDDRNDEGVDVLREIAKHYPSIPTLVLSGRLTVDLTQQVLKEYGAESIIEKDRFELEEFIKLVTKHLRVLPTTQEFFLGHGFTPAQIKDLRRAISKALTPMDLKPYFPDQEVEQEFILRKIKEKIFQTRFSVFDISLLRSNVFIEIGIAIGLNRPLLIVVEQEITVPEVLEGLVKIRYSNFSSLTQELECRIKDWMQLLETGRQIGRSYCQIQGKRCDGQNGGQERTYLIADVESSKSTDFRNAVMRALEPWDFRPVFLGGHASSEPLLCQYCKQVQSTAFGVYRIFADATAEIFFALGLAIGLNVPYLLLVEAETAIPSNLKGLDRFQYQAFADIETCLAAKTQPLWARIRGSRKVL